MKIKTLLGWAGVLLACVLISGLLFILLSLLGLTGETRTIVHIFLCIVAGHFIGRASVKRGWL